MADDWTADAELNRFWNELVCSGSEPALGCLQPDQAETLRRLHAMTQAPLPAGVRNHIDRAMRLRLNAPAPVGPRNGHAPADVRPTAVVALGWAWSTEAPALSPGRTGPSAPPTPQSVTRRRGWGPIQLAATLLLLTILGLAFVALGPSRTRTDQRAMLPAVSGGSADESLLELTLPAEVLPHGDRVSGTLNDYSLAVGAETSWEPAAGACCPGLRLTFVVEGSLAIRPAAAAHMLRAGVALSPDIVPAGTEVVLEPGDAFLSRFEAAFSSRNPGPAPARFLDLSVIDGFFPLNSAPPGWERHADGGVTNSMSLHDQPATLRLTKVVLESGATLPPPPGAFTQLGVTIADDESVEMSDTESIENINDDPVTVHVVTILPVAAQSPRAAPKEALETVFATTLPAEMIPAAGNLDFIVWRGVMDPGVRQSLEGKPRGPQMLHVLEGDLTLTAEGPLQISRGSTGISAGVGLTEVAPGKAIVLHPGDTAVYAFDQQVEYANLGEAAVHFVAGGLFAGHSAWLPDRVTVLDHNEQYPVPALPSGPVQITLIRATLPPGGGVPAPPAGSLMLDVGAVKESDIAKRMDGSVHNIGPDEAAIYVLTMTPTGQPGPDP